MVGYAWAVGDMAAAVDFLLTPDFSRITGATMLDALGQAFFSIGIAMAVMITYGSYLERKTSIPQNAFIVVAADTLVACLAGFAIFPLVFQHGLSPDAGTGLVFQTLPIAFGGLPGGQLFGAIFFLLLIAAAITSCIGIFAPVVAWTEERFRVSHSRASLIAGVAMWIAGFLSVFSFNVLAGYYPLDFLPGFETMTFYDSIDYIMSKVLLPVGALLTSVFIGWRVSGTAAQQEMDLSNAPFRLWQALMRFVVPVAVTFIFVQGISG